MMKVTVILVGVIHKHEIEIMNIKPTFRNTTPSEGPRRPKYNYVAVNAT